MTHWEDSEVPLCGVVLRGVSWRGVLSDHDGHRASAHLLAPLGFFSPNQPTPNYSDQIESGQEQPKAPRCLPVTFKTWWPQPDLGVRDT